MSRNGTDSFKGKKPRNTRKRDLKNIRERDLQCHRWVGVCTVENVKERAL